MDADKLNPIQVIRAAASRLRPYYSAAVFNLHPVEKPGIGTFGVDKYWRLYYDPACLDKWSLTEATWVNIHEVLHAIFDHCAFAEANNWDPKQANWAFDLAINSWLRKDGAKLPEGCLLPEQFGFPDLLSKEEYYELLSKLIDKNKGKGLSKPGQGKGTGEGDGDGRAEPGAGNCGSIAGNPAPWEDPAPSAGGGPGVENELEKELIRRQVAEEIKRSGGRGSVPSELARWAEEVLGDKTDWRRLLTSAVRSAAAGVRRGQADYSFRKLARRTLSQPGGFLYPGMVEAIPDVALVIDTSGSVGDDWLGVALNVINRVARSLACPVRVLSCDAAIHGAAIRTGGGNRRLGLGGGGGTDMGRGIEGAMELKPKPNIIIVVTDLETPWPSERPRATCIVVGPEGSSAWAQVPAWAVKVAVRQ